MTLPAVGTLSYNDVEFDVLHRSHVTSTPIPDSSGRTTKFVKHVIDVDAWISGNMDDSTDDLDETMDDLRKLLTQPAGELKYDAKGFGDFHVNGTSRVVDADWGPKPKLLGFKPLGGGFGALVSFQVETVIPECDDARYSGISELNYTVKWSIDRNGITTRTINGHLEIHNNRSQGDPRRVQVNADSLRERIRPVVPDGFFREAGDFTLSESRNRLDFTFVDKQIVRPLPGYASTVECEQTVQPVQIKGAMAFNRWQISLVGTITLPPDRPRSEAWDVFLIVLNSRLQNVALGNQIQTTVKGTKEGQAYLRWVRWSEQIFGWTSSFDVRYEFIAATLSEILKASGLWQPIKGTSWAQYKKNLDPTAWGARGTAGLRHLDGEEIIIDLCAPSKVNPPSTVGNKPTLPPGKDKPDFSPLPPEAEYTWRMYENIIWLHIDDRKARHRPLPIQQETNLNAKPDATTKDVMSFARIERAEDIQEKKPKKTEIVQHLGSPIYTIIMEGSAERINEDIPIPRLIKVGGIEVVQLSAYIQKGIVGSIGLLPINAAAWRIAYSLPDKFTGELPSLVNPVYKLPGG